MSRRAGRDDDLLLVLHELRNPLVGIDAAARVLARDLDGHPATGRASAIAAEARHLLQLLESVSEAEAASIGRLRSTLRPVDLAALVRETASGFQRDRSVVLHCPNEPVMVAADAGRIRQVLVNLLTNAVQYSPAGTSVDVSLRVRGNTASVDVHDRGPGIPAAERRRLFRKFARLSTAAGTRGSGLGLYICRAVVGDHGGAIRHTAGPGGGSIFSFTIPMKKGRGPKRETRRREATSGPARGSAR